MDPLMQPLETKKGFPFFVLPIAIIALVIFALKIFFLPPLITKKVEAFVTKEWLTPLDTGKRKDWNSLLVPRKGRFLEERPAYSHLEAHFHTGIDIQNRRHRGGPGEPVYAAAKGKVYDVKVQGEGTRVTVLHLLPNGELVYTSYIHVADVRVKKGMKVNPSTVIARRLNREELKKYGQIYNHLHFQIHKSQFVPQDTILSKSREQVKERFYDPKEFFYHHPADSVPDWRQWVKEGKISLWKLFWTVF